MLIPLVNPATSRVPLPAVGPAAINAGLVGWWRLWPHGCGMDYVHDAIADNHAVFSIVDPFFVECGQLYAGREQFGIVSGSGLEIEMARPPLQDVAAFSIGLTVFGRGGLSGTGGVTGIFGQWDGSPGFVNQTLWRNSGGMQTFVRDAADTAHAGPIVTSPTDQWVRYLLRGDGLNLSLWSTAADGTRHTGTAALAGPYFPPATIGWMFGRARSNADQSRFTDCKIWNRWLNDEEAEADAIDGHRLAPLAARVRSLVFVPGTLSGGTPIVLTGVAGSGQGSGQVGGAVVGAVFAGAAGSGQGTGALGSALTAGALLGGTAGGGTGQGTAGGAFVGAVFGGVVGTGQGAGQVGVIVAGSSSPAVLTGVVGTGQGAGQVGGAVVGAVFAGAAGSGQGTGALGSALTAGAVLGGTAGGGSGQGTAGGAFVGAVFGGVAGSGQGAGQVGTLTIATTASAVTQWLPWRGNAAGRGGWRGNLNQRGEWRADES